MSGAPPGTLTRPSHHVKGENGPSSRGGWLGPFSVIPQDSSAIGPNRTSCVERGGALTSPLQARSACPGRIPRGVGVDGDRDADRFRLLAWRARRLRDTTGLTLT